MQQDMERILLSEEQIQARIEELGQILAASCLTLCFPSWF